MRSAATPSETLTRPRTLVDAVEQAPEVGTAGAPDGSPGPAGSDSLVESIEAQRERAQQEFKRIWALCALPQ